MYQKVSIPEEYYLIAVNIFSVSPQKNVTDPISAISVFRRDAILDEYWFQN
ncbi:hypothetical protein HZQ67_13045 [Elizabethkingia anophelis]|uniref:hypothetical protein n=1 Tax=Elizabethkingia anophelis TaxID=1117645 RepID=UPI000AF84D61|nr:hypothetical protein [Elizabethkingia anophelis]MCT3788295.1 hypothetical protein [Elizabethkingia anophelis]